MQKVKEETLRYQREMDQLDLDLSSQQKKEREDELKRIRYLEHKYWKTETVLQKIVKTFAETIEPHFGELQELMTKFHQRQERDLAS